MHHIFTLAVTCASVLSAQADWPLDTRFSGGVANSFPIGLEKFNNAVNASAAAWLPLRGKRGPDAPASFKLGASAEYLWMRSDDNANGELQFLGMGLGLGFSREAGENIVLDLEAIGGYYLSDYLNYDLVRTTGGSAYASGNLGIGFWIMDKTTLDIGLRYSYFASLPEPLMQAFTPALGLSYRGSSRRSATTPLLRIETRQIDAIFPILRKSYADSPFGRITITNGEGRTIKDVTIRVFIPDFMDTPTECLGKVSLSPGQSLEVPLRATFNGRVYDIQERRNSTGEIEATYDVGTKVKRMTVTESVTLEAGNAAAWEEEGSIAGFITAKDPLVLKFARNINASIRGDPAADFDRDIAFALCVYEELSGFSPGKGEAFAATGMDPPRPRIERIQYPRRTLESRSGNGVDLTVLYAASLEAMGIETAILDIDGRVLPAFMPKRRSFALSVLANQGYAITDSKGRTWLPVDFSGKGLFAALRQGTRLWNGKGNSGNLISIREAWKSVDPADMGMDSRDDGIGDPRLPAAALLAELDEFTREAISSQEKEIKEKLVKGQNPDDSALNNVLGVLYARFGLLAKAAACFEKSAKAKGASAALVNLGNIAFIRGDYPLAISYFEGALAPEKKNPAILINLARVYFETENYGTAKELYREAVALNPEYEREYGFMLGGAESSLRSASRDELPDMEWINE